MDSEAFEIARGLYNSKGMVFGQLTVYVDNSILHDKLNYARKFLTSTFLCSFKKIPIDSMLPWVCAVTVINYRRL